MKPTEAQGLVLPSIGVFSGLASSTFVSEMAARALGKVGYVKAMVKTGVKVALGTLFFGTGVGIPGSGVIMYPAAIAAFGSIPLDWIEARFPGGVYGLAERAAVVVRRWSMGVETVQTEIESLGNTLIETGGEFHPPLENTHTKAAQEIRAGPLMKDHATPPEAMTAEPPLGMRLVKA